ncbi:MAG: trypsin-like serine protease [Nitrosomonas sp.]|nr:trypsin-like serine protease [Nitrosomonas sp.]
MRNLLTIVIATSLAWGSMLYAQNYSWSTTDQIEEQVTIPIDKQIHKGPIAVEISVPDSIIPGQGTAEFWTPERLRNAKPVKLPRASEYYPTTEILESDDYEEQISEPGQAPIIKIKPNKTKLFEPLKNEISDDEFHFYNEEDVDPSSYGTSGAYFTSSSVSPAPATQNSRPYSATGRLFYTDKAGRLYSCTASVIKPRLILTAGHCVYDAVKKQWYTNFIFIPALHKGSEPYGSWIWSGWAVTTTNWINSGGKLPNAGDFAIIEMKDNSSKRRIGDITGHYGYRLNALHPNHVTILGYPTAFNSGNWLHRVDSQSFRATFSNTVEFGADMTAGASGGGMIENFGMSATGQSVSGSMNTIVGVTSYMPSNTSQRYLGSSILNSQFTNGSKNGILDVACAHKAGNC